RTVKWTSVPGAARSPQRRWLPMLAGPVKPRRRLAAVGVLERRLGAVLHAELREEMLHVELHRVVGQAEPLGDLRVGEPAGDERPDLALARREVARCCRPAFDPATRGLGEHELTRVHLPDRRQRLLGWLGFQREAFRTGVERR